MLLGRDTQPMPGRVATHLQASDVTKTFIVHDSKHMVREVLAVDLGTRRSEKEEGLRLETPLHAQGRPTREWCLSAQHSKFNRRP